MSTLPATLENSDDGGSAQSLERRFSLLRAKEKCIQTALLGCALLSIGTTLSIIYVLFTTAVYSFGEETAFFQDVSTVDFLTGTEWTPTFAEQHFGALPLIVGTLMIAAIAGLIGIPIGLACAIYLAEYAHPKTRAWMKPTLEILAGIPTVVYGYLALVLLTPYVLEPISEALFGARVGVFNALSAGIVVGLMVVPMVASLSEDALRAVPRGLREAGYALGSTRFDVAVRVVLPAAFSGVVSSFLLAIARAIGETMAVAMAAGQSPSMSANVLEGHQTMTGFIVSISLSDAAAGTLEYKSLYAVALTLFCMTLAMNVLSQRIMRRYREVYE